MRFYKCLISGLCTPYLIQRFTLLITALKSLFVEITYVYDHTLEGTVKTSEKGDSSEKRIAGDEGSPVLVGNELGGWRWLFPSLRLEVAVGYWLRRGSSVVVGDDNDMAGEGAPPEQR
ncbi:hypothetical protein L2E82_46048 [Cichorium intybus]|uniref:Uncharacterized protein n=1 Tax=Cichorium intybus TaxID=13427 RepID=A0ACB8YTQ6_CICIN|nr:hypothetical protein L2E82_46048 [Cichorium intybus]